MKKTQKEWRAENETEVARRGQEDTPTDEVASSSFHDVVPKEGARMDNDVARVEEFDAARLLLQIQETRELPLLPRKVQKRIRDLQLCRVMVIVNKVIRKLM
jgi:hypothetical protein